MTELELKYLNLLEECNLLLGNTVTLMFFQSLNSSEFEDRITKYAKLSKDIYDVRNQIKELPCQMEHQNSKVKSKEINSNIKSQKK